MVTQKIVTRLSNDTLPPVRMVSGDVGREIQLEIYASDDSENPIDLETYSAEITIIKPDNTFIMDNFDGDMYELPEQAGAVSGFGYYQIKIFTSGKRQIYTGQGPFLVDDMILSDDVIESSSIAFGDRFPEDFATKTWVDDEIAAHGIGTYVAGNVPEEETMPPLVKLQINDDIYPLIHKVEEQEDADITNPAEGDVLTYDANDQKWKNEPLVIPDPTVTKTATGNPIEFTDCADAPLVKCTTAITGSQDLHGYDKPWVGGAGKNKIPMTVDSIKSANTSGTWSGNTYTLNGVTFTIETDNADNVTGIKVNNSTVPTGITYFDLVDTFDSTTYAGMIFSGLPSNTPTGFTIRASENNRVSLQEFYPGDVPIVDNGNGLKLAIRLSTNVIANNVEIVPMIRLSTESDSTFAPYSNICPITAYTEGEIEVSDGDGNVTTHTATFSNSIYQGNADFVGGTVTTEWGVIASYAGETLPGEWISDRDEYAPGTTPTTGAQVAYALATPTTSSITPSNLPIKSLSGYTHIESSTGDMEVEYITQQWDPIMKAEQLDNMKVYSTDEQVVGKWVDGSDVKEKTYIYTGTGAANPFTTTIDFTGKSIIEVIPHYVKYTYGGGTVGYCAGSNLVNNNSNLLNVAYDANTPPTVSVTSYIGSNTETYEVAFTIRYI